MDAGWRYRLVAVGGATALVVAAVAAANLPPVQRALTALPILNNLKPVVLTRTDLVDEVATTLVVVLGALWPLFKPRRRRILDTVSLTEQRLFLATTALATLGYFDWSTRLPRTTLIAAMVALGVALPLWFVYIRRQPRSSTRAVIVGDDVREMERLRGAAEVPIIGFVAPPSVEPRVSGAFAAPTRADGGEGFAGLERLGGLSRLDEVLVEHDVDTVLLGFEQSDREEFFGTLSTCYERGVRAMVHRDQADSVLVADPTGGELVDTDLVPWDWQDYAVKRAFDVAFAGLGLLALSPVVVAVAAAIKLDSGGPALYSQRRTAAFGGTFRVFKFRTMVPDAEADTGARISAEDRGDVDPRVTRVGRILRPTHLDEIPQLWSILVGDMSVVGPRPERPELDADIGSDVDEWRSRWFVKPGLTGLAQINGVTGHDPERKLRYDVEYIRRQSLWFDMKIVLRQLWQVGKDARGVVRDLRRRPDETADSAASAETPDADDAGGR